MLDPFDPVTPRTEVAQNGIAPLRKENLVRRNSFDPFADQFDKLRMKRQCVGPAMLAGGTKGTGPYNVDGCTK